MDVWSSRPELSELQNRVMTIKWEALGLQLGLKNDELVAIREQRSGNVAACRKDMFALWLRTKPNASRRQLLDALRTNCIAEVYMAEQYEIYIRDELSQNGTTHHAKGMDKPEDRPPISEGVSQKNVKKNLGSSIPWPAIAIVGVGFLAIAIALVFANSEGKGESVATQRTVKSNEDNINNVQSVENEKPETVSELKGDGTGGLIPDGEDLLYYLSGITEIQLLCSSFGLGSECSVIVKQHSDLDNQKAEMLRNWKHLRTRTWKDFIGSLALLKYCVDAKQLASEHSVYFNPSDWEDKKVLNNCKDINRIVM